MRLGNLVTSCAMITGTDMTEILAEIAALIPEIVFATLRPDP